MFGTISSLIKPYNILGISFGPYGTLVLSLLESLEDSIKLSSFEKSCINFNRKLIPPFRKSFRSSDMGGRISDPISTMSLP